MIGWRRSVGGRRLSAICYISVYELYVTENPTCLHVRRVWEERVRVKSRQKNSPQTIRPHEEKRGAVLATLQGVQARAMGCSGSKPDVSDTSLGSAAEVTAASQQQHSPVRRDSKLVKLPSGGFASAQSPLFREYLELLGPGAPGSVSSIDADDALLVIDMQNDFIPADPVENPDGGRFGVAEGADIVQPIVQLIEHFVKCGGSVYATRDYHPHDHCSFLTQGGPFPAHCVQGTAGSKFYPPISRALAAGRQAGGKVAVAFKAMHEDVDSFGGLPYHGGGDGRITTRGGGRDAERGLPVMMGCASAPWTGSLLLKQSAIECAGEQGFGLDMDAPPDVFACLGDGRERGLQSLADVLSGHKRVFVCGLALDFCVLDSCLNAVSMPTPPKAVHMVLDAARAAHIPGVGSYGSGFLSDPKDVLSKLGAAHVHLSSVESVTGAAPLGEYPLELGFPRSLGPLGLVAADSKVRITVSAAKQTYQVSEHARRVTRRRRAAKQRAQLPAQSSAACLCSPRRPSAHLLPHVPSCRPSLLLPASAPPAAPPHTCCLTAASPLPHRFLATSSPLLFPSDICLVARSTSQIVSGLDGSLFTNLSSTSRCSPKAPIPAAWPGAPPIATSLCWAYPLAGINELQGSSQYGFLSVTSSPALQVAAYGGFLLLDRRDQVVSVQAIAPSDQSMALRFGGARAWRGEFTAALEAEGRFQPVTLPVLRAAGADSFCWLSPSESFTSGPEAWAPSMDGAFLYRMSDGSSVWFPAVPNISSV